MEHPCPGQVNISFHANPTAMDPDASCYLESCYLESTQNAGQDLRSSQGCKTSQSSIEPAQLLQLALLSLYTSYRRMKEERSQYLVSRLLFKSQIRA
jgi:hypothetical protein